MSLDPRRTASGALALAVASALVLTSTAAFASPGPAGSSAPGTATAAGPLATAADGTATVPRLEHLDRGLVAALTDDGVFVGWRLLGQEVTGSSETGMTGSDFVVYRDGAAIGTVTDSTTFLDPEGSTGSVYQVAALVDGVEQETSAEVTPWADTFRDVPLERPADGVTPVGETYTYSANDMSVGDVDGDGTYELVVKWDPSNAKDVSQRGYTGPVYIDTYRVDGTLLHRVDLGVNIRAGAHYTQFLVYDLDGDGRAEMMLKTAPGTRSTTFGADGQVTAESSVTMPQADVDAGYTHADDYRMSADDYREHLVEMFQGWSEHPEVVSGAWPATLQEAWTLVDQPDRPAPAPLRDMGYPLSREDAEEAADYFLDVYAPARSDRNVLRELEGFVVDGPEYLTVFDGETGAELQTVPYTPERHDDGLMWGDYAMSRIEPGNRVDRFLSTVAYLDGERPSAVFARGYYTRSALVAYDWDGTDLTERWTVDSGWTPMSNPFDDEPHGVEGTDPVFGTLTTQGFHSLSSADVDGDGTQEIVYGSATIDSDGQSLLYSSYDTIPAGPNAGDLAKLGHGDAMHVTDIDPDRPGLEIFTVHEGGEWAPYGYALRDAKTGEVLFGAYSGRDTGRGMIGDVVPGNRGIEVWAGMPDGTSGAGLRSAQGDLLTPATPGTNMSILWQPDLTRQVVEGSGTQTPVIREVATGDALLTATGTLTNNGTKGTPSLVADIVGDWREELLVRTEDSSAVRIYTSATVSEAKMYTLMHDPQYRVEVARQRTTYNQPSYVGFYLASGMTAEDWSRVPVPTIVTEPTLAVGASATSAVSGEVVVLDVTVGSGYPTGPSGEVELAVDGAPTGAPVVLVDGAVSLEVPALPVGDHSLAVRYLGDSRYSPVESGTVPLVVRQGSVDVLVASAGPPASAGAAVASTAAADVADAGAAVLAAAAADLTVSVVPQAPAAGIPTGAVSATVDGAPVEVAAELVDGAAVLTLPDLPAGDRTVVVTYSGDAAFVAAESVALVVTVADDGTAVPGPVPGYPTPGDDPGDPTAPVPPGAGAAQPGPGLAVTGADVTLLAAVALLLAAGGAVTVRTVRRRRGTAG